VFVANRPITAEEVNDAFRQEATDERYRGILGASDDPLVSADIVGDPRAAVIDLDLTRVVDGTLVKVMAWYDNEWGFSSAAPFHGAVQRRLPQRRGDVGRKAVDARGYFVAPTVCVAQVAAGIARCRSDRQTASFDRCPACPSVAVQAVSNIKPGGIYHRQALRGSVLADGRQPCAPVLTGVAPCHSGRGGPGWTRRVVPDEPGGEP
jgi:hypothetical protein